MRGKCIALLLGAALAAFPVRGEQEGASGASARDVQEIVRTIETHYHAAHTLQAAFLERFSEGAKVVRLESGIVYFSRPGRMRWEYESPENKLFLADGKTAWFYVPADRTVTRARMKESTDWRTPLALLTGKAKLSRLCGLIELVNQPRTPAGHAVLRCLPRESAPKAPPGQVRSAADASVQNGSFHEVFLEVDAASGELARVLVRQAGGVELEYRFGNWRENIALPEALFHFQPPAGVAIVDEASVGLPSY